MSISAPLGRYQFVQEFAIDHKLQCPLGTTQPISPRGNRLARSRGPRTGRVQNFGLGGNRERFANIVEQIKPPARNRGLVYDLGKV